MTRDSIALPIAIVAAAGLIAGAIYFNGESASTNNQAAAPAAADITPANATALRQVDETDHVKGNPNAPIMLIEYSDFDCPYCKLFHETLNRIIAEYGADGKVAWTYRHLPIKQLHPNAHTIAEASECVAASGGDFWKFADSVFGERDVRESTNITLLPDFAVKAGANKTQYESCLNSGTFREKVNKSVEEFIGVTGGRVGTPHTFVVVGDQSYPIEGAQPYEVVKKLIDNLVGQMEGRAPNQ